VRLPGFRPGKIPNAVLEERYGPQARLAVLQAIALSIADRGLPPGSLASGCQLVPGDADGDVAISISATHLPDLPDPDFSQFEIERIAVEGHSSPESPLFLRERIKSQVLDRLDAIYSFPVFPGAVEREFASIRRLTEANGPRASGDERKKIESEMRRIAERRLRLGMVILELARRLQIKASTPAQLEDLVIDFFLAKARVMERTVSPNELREFMAEWTAIDSQ
jgi:FKBP-type peptidyl-prolyl cis-trans isomerase (trigger factor)